MGKKVKRKEIKNVIDKKGWPKGEWLKEPDWVTFLYEEDKIVLACVLRRDPRYGNWLGYVGVSSDNFYYKLDCLKQERMFEALALRVDYLREITFTDFDKNFDSLNSVKGYWYLGFGTNNPSVDFVPLLEVYEPKLNRDRDGYLAVYKNVAYAERVVENLAKQIIKKQKEFIVAQARAKK